jgi:hypothetical protein
MFSSCRLLLMTGLLTACEVTSLELQSPGTPGAPDSLKADLSPGPIEAPDRLRVDELLQMRVGVGNSGNRIAGPGWFIRVLLSNDAHIDSTDQLIEQFVATRELVPGAQDFYLRNIKLTCDEPGDYYIGSILDVTDVVAELSDSNNALATPGRITLLPVATGQ